MKFQLSKEFAFACVATIMVAFLQFFLFDEIEIRGIRLHFIIIALVLSAIVLEDFNIVVVGFIVGLIYDMLDGNMGVQAFSKTVSCFIASFFFQERKKKYRVDVVIGIIFFITLVDSFIRIVLYDVFKFFSAEDVFIKLFFSSLFSCVFAFMIIRLVPFLRKFFL